jgi:hypothetical protein
MPFLTVNIASAGTALSGGGKSAVGHMWFSLDNGDGSSPLSYGFAPDESHHGRPFAQGQVYGDDNEKYTSTYYTRTIEISRAQYDAIKGFGDATKAGGAGSAIHVTDINGRDQSFTLNYNALINSCIDYVWKGLEISGINPAGFQGALWPTWNKAFLDDALKKYEEGIGSRGLLFDSDKQIQDWYYRGEIDTQTWKNYNDWSTSQLVNGGVDLPPSPDPELALDPIGAFYDSQSRAYDRAPSIAASTPVALDTNNRPLTAAQLTALDANRDGKLSGTELATLKLWRDLNENGRLEGGELAAAGATPILSRDYVQLTRGNGVMGAPAPAESAGPQVWQPGAPTTWRPPREAQRRGFENTRAIA